MFMAQESGIGICWLLTIIFMVLKLTGTIAWSWWWVFSPLWIPFALAIVVAFIILIVVGISMALENKKG
jgi:membrane protein YdbS with pleckstrin-like domain